MKKLVTSGLRRMLCAWSTCLAVLALTSIHQAHAQQGCVMTCSLEPFVEISLPSSCLDTVTYLDLGVTIPGCMGEIIVDIMDNGMSIGDTINASMIGNTYMVIVSNPESGQSCMTAIKVVDKQPPIVNCPDDITLACNTDLDDYVGLVPDDISDCSPTNISKEDSLIFFGNCNGNIVSRYQRTYVVADTFNNADTCIQIISLAKANLADVIFPPGFSGPNALSCFPPPDTSPDATGYPTVDGNPILNGTFCNLSAVPMDVVADLCSGSYKIFRTWTVYDWCDGSASTSAMQVIEVLDMTPPVVTAPADMTVSTGEFSCSANGNVPPASITEDCSDSWTVRMEGPFGTIHSNGGLISGLPVGKHNIIFKATNDCIQTDGVDTMCITVLDLVPPSPVCNQGLGIPVNNIGIAIIPASVFNAGSTDNCGQVFFKVRRMDTPVGYSCANAGNPNNLFDDYIQFCCDDIAHNNIMVIFRVYDVQPIPGPVADNYLQGHFNECMVQVEVQDKLPPQVICPSDLTISCEFPYALSNLEVFGSIALSEAEREMICIDDPGVPGNPGLQCIGLDGLATDNCYVEVVENAPIVSINNCGVGTIVRNFTVMDDGGLQRTCQQTITVINYDPFDVSDITWPLDYTTFDICEISLLDPEDLSFPYSQPLLNDGICDLVGATYTDDVFDFTNPDQACFKILRTWKVVDWCQLNTPAGGIWTRIQVIKVMNSEAPVIEPIADLSECSFDPQCGGLTIDFEAIADDDCSGPASLTWKYYIDFDNNNSFDFISGFVTGDTIRFSKYMPIGTHRILYTVGDKCGNTSAEEQYVTIESCKLPSPKCIHGLSTSLMPMDTDGDGIADWGMVTMQAQMFDAGSDHPCGNRVSVAFSPDPNDITKVFDCSSIVNGNVIDLDIWAIDENGLADFCPTTLLIQDNAGICPPSPAGGATGVISGSISVPQAGSLSGAMVYLDGSNLPGSLSANNGYFIFPSMPFGGQYVVRPVRDGDAKNGVSTLDLVKIQKHLLGIETFSTPFQYIAADANNNSNVSAIDLIQLRKLILGYYNELPNNTSWRFVDKAHVFPDPNNPWLSTWPEIYSIIPFGNSMNEIDFNAVKIGDLNLSANLQAGNGMILPRGQRPCQLEYAVHAQTDENIYRVDIYLLKAEMYNAVQFSFNWDQNNFKLLDWSPGETLSRDDVRMPEQNGENASLAAFAVDGWRGEKMPILTLWVEKKSPQGYPFQLFLNPGPTPPLGYELAHEEEVNVQLAASKVSEPLIHNRPNPFSNLTTIIMQSQRAEKATLRIYDLNGRLVYTRDVNLIKGENEFIITRTELRNAGLYLYEIESSFQYSTNRMIIVE